MMQAGPASRADPEKLLAALHAAIADATSAARGPIQMSRSIKALLLSPVVILFASAVRLLLISNYNTTVATTVAAAGGVAGTLLGTIVPLLPPFLPAIFVLLVVARRWVLVSLTGLAIAAVSPAYSTAFRGWNEAYPLFHRYLGLMQVSDWTFLSQHPVIAFTSGLAVALALWDPPRLLQRQKGKDPIATLVFAFVRFCLSAMYGVAVAAATMLSLLFIQSVYRIPIDRSTLSQVLRRPWVPTEKIVLKSGSVHIGYMLSTKDKWFLVLNEHDRTIDYIFADDVLSRSVCSLNESQDSVPSPLLRLEGIQVASTALCTQPQSDASSPGIAPSRAID